MIYLTWFADELRTAGLTVIEMAGWQSRGRRNGDGYAAQPLCVMEHHTASPPSWDGSRDANYCATGDSDAPLSNLYIDRKGQVWVLAAGATNTNGKGQALPFSRGTVPQDGMNTRAIGIECGNNGVGETWPQAQVDALMLTANTCNRRVGNQPTDIAGHVHYAVGRKIDPATCNVAGPWQPRSINSSGSWNLDDMRAEHARRASAPPPEPEDEVTDDDIERIATRAAQLVWAQQVSVPQGGTQPYGWVVGQTYVATLRTVTASEQAAANTRT